MKVFLVAGAWPNFMKIAPIYRASLAYGDVDCQIIHTGQHYDYEMSQAFFEDLEIPKPQYFLDAGSGPHAVQTAKIMVAFEEVCIKEKPDLIMVVGDVNSTLACSIVAKKLLINVAHVEAGLRSFREKWDRYLFSPENQNDNPLFYSSLPRFPLGCFNLAD